MERPYNPLEKQHLGESLVRALLARPCRPLPPGASFPGAGVYVLYYHGDFGPYGPVSRANQRDKCSAPIYVGHARLSGARKGIEADPELGQESLFGRLSEHAESISAVKNLALEHFTCRYLVVDELWVTLAERLLIESYQPLWNRVIDGFGIHTPGKGRKKQKRSAWDVLHPGRPFVKRLRLLPGKYTAEELIAEIKQHFKDRDG